ncbi:MAG: DUF4340 domain-containing protein [Bacteroidota bacterium]
MKKNLWLLLLFLVLGGGTAWYLLGKSKQKSTLGWDRMFKVENPDDIHKIFLAKRTTGETTTLERQGKDWIYNGKWKARPGAIKNLLEAVTQVQLKYVPPQAAIPGIVKDLATRSIKVEVYNKAGKNLKTYYVGGTTADGRGTYMIMENSDLPHVMELPLMEGLVLARYDLSGEDWRDRAVFSYQPEEIQAVSMEYPTQRSKSFRLEKTGDSYSVKPFYENTQPIERPISKGRVEAFLTGFERLVAEGFENGYEYKDSIRQLIPFTVITVKDTKGNEKKAALYSSYIAQSDIGGGRTKDVVERYFADVSTGDFMLVQDLVFNKIFWAYEAFFEEPGKQVKD